ncbi:MAG: hypothetical protein LBH42_00250, partial [Treponema sp.]|nr:hypothetical protein [Treponema sp.]
MSVRHYTVFVQLFSLLFFSFCIVMGCRRYSEELPVTPPSTHPLTREYIGFGVVNATFTNVLSDPGPTGVSQGYLRKGTVVRIIERRQIINQGNAELWILAEANYQSSYGTQSFSASAGSRGWLQAETME